MDTSRVHCIREASRSIPVNNVVFNAYLIAYAKIANVTLCDRDIAATI